MFELSDQKKEILAHDGHVLVLGGPGSGKTTISIIKADLVASNLSRETQKVLFLSFARATVARVGEALTEYSRERPDVRRRVLVDTYHAFFWRLIQTHGYLLGLPRKLQILAPPAEAVALSGIRHDFGPMKRLSDEEKRRLRELEQEELNRLAFEEGKICFDAFADFTSQLLSRSRKIRQLISSAYPVVILDEFQDTNGGQWLVVQHLGIGSTLIALADPDQRIYDFAGADPERINHFRDRFAPKEFDLSDENHRSAGTDIARFGDDLLRGRLGGNYAGVVIKRFAANQNQAIAALKGQTLQARKRLIDTGRRDWSLAILVPTKRMMRLVSDALRTRDGSMPAIEHYAAIGMAGAILAAEVIAFLLQPREGKNDFLRFVELVCNFFRGRGGDEPSKTDIRESLNIERALERALKCEREGKEPPTRSIIRGIRTGYEECTKVNQTGNPDDDWVAIRTALESCDCPRIVQIAEEVRNVRFLDRGTQLREALSLDWRDNGAYPNALDIVRQAFVQEHFATSNRRESGVVVMNMHKAKGKQFDEVIIFEGWPRIVKGTVVANLDRIVPKNRIDGDIAHARYNLRVSVTRARTRTTIMTPDVDPCVLLGSGH